MISQEILKKVRKIEIITRRIVNDIFAGEYHSIFNKPLPYALDSKSCTHHFYTA